MDVKALVAFITGTDADTIILFHAEGAELQESAATVNDALGGAIQELIDGGDFSGKSGEMTVIYPRGAITARRVIVIGTGKANADMGEEIRRDTAAAIKRARELKAGRTAIALPVVTSTTTSQLAQAITEGALLGAYRYHGQKSDDETPEYLTSVEILSAESEQAAIESGIAVGKALAVGASTARDLVNLPPNICTPSYLASIARNIAERGGMKIEVLERQQMETLGMGALLAVAQGSETPPRFIIMEHNADRAAELDTIVLVGKGVTFDTGGYSIKTSEGMVGMKADMGGGAAVIGAMQAVAALNLPLHVVGLVPASDNMISGKAYRPQDVVTAGNGKTIEIISTDAEGRLLLADALVYAKRYEPAAVVDIATLTGACVVALGGVAAGFFCTDNTLRDRLNAAADRTGEKVWQLPLFPEYKKQIESDTADMKNTGGRPGGACTAAVFLQQFVDYPAWAHIDMAGVMTDVANNPYIPAKGASGYGARLLAEFARRWAEKVN